jgi:hypothetical protein
VTLLELLETMADKKYLAFDSTVFFSHSDSNVLAGLVPKREMINQN